MNLNKAMIIGRITNDLELKTTPTGRQVLSFSVATNYTYKDQSGQKIEQTEFHNVVAWGKQAEIISKYFVKGQEIYVEGRLATRNWVDESSQKKMYRTEIILNNFEFGAKPNGGSSVQNNNFNNNSNFQPSQTQTNDKNITNKQTPEIEYPDQEIDPEDIPF